jgi:hypothetical protein
LLVGQNCGILISSEFSDTTSPPAKFVLAMTVLSD